MELFLFDGKQLKSIETLTFNDNIIQSLFFENFLFLLTIDLPHFHSYELDKSTLKISELKTDFISTINNNTTFKIDDSNLTTFGIKKRKLEEKENGSQKKEFSLFLKESKKK